MNRRAIAACLLLICIPLPTAGAGDEPSFDGVPAAEWRQRLASDDFAVRNTAIRALVRGKSEAVPVLLTSLDPSHFLFLGRLVLREIGEEALPVLRTRGARDLDAATTRAFRTIGGRRAAALLFSWATIHRVPNADRSAASTLPFLGNVATPWIRLLLEHGRPGVREVLLESLALVRERPEHGLPDFPALLPGIVANLRHEGVDVRAAAAWALAGLDPDRWETVGPELIARLADDGWRVRAVAARTISTFGPVAIEAVPPLLENLDTPAEDHQFASRPDYVVAALTALRRLDAVTPGRTALLTESLDDECERVRVAAAACLVELGFREKESLRTLMRAALHGSRGGFRGPPIGWSAGEVAEGFLSEAAVARSDSLDEVVREELIPVLVDPDAEWSVRLNAVLLAGRLSGQSELLLPVLRGLRDDDSLGHHALVSLVRLGDELPALRVLSRSASLLKGTLLLDLRDIGPDVRPVAADLAKAVLHPVGAEEILPMLKACGDLDPAALAPVSRLLGGPIGKHGAVAGEILLANAAAAIPVLEARLRDGERDTRQAVVGLLAKMQGIDEVADAARMALRDIVREGSGELERLAREALSE